MRAKEAQGKKRHQSTTALSAILRYISPYISTPMNKEEWHKPWMAMARTPTTWNIVSAMDTCNINVPAASIVANIRMEGVLSHYLNVLANSAKMSAMLPRASRRSIQCHHVQQPVKTLILRTVRRRVTQ